MVKIGIYGGTFNPPHTGHLHAAKQAAQLLGLDKLLLIPDRIAPTRKFPQDHPHRSSGSKCCASRLRENRPWKFLILS